MVNQDDKRVAEAIEDKPIYGNKHACESGAWEIVYRPGAFDWYPRPFITAPTCCTEEIVFEAKKDDVDFWVEIYGILTQRAMKPGFKFVEERHGKHLNNLILMRKYEVGMWALALLEVLKDG